MMIFNKLLKTKIHFFNFIITFFVKTCIFNNFLKKKENGDRKRGKRKEKKEKI